jgi:hypothetical protein
MVDNTDTNIADITQAVENSPPAQPNGLTATLIARSPAPEPTPAPAPGTIPNSSLFIPPPPFDGVSQDSLRAFVENNLQQLHSALMKVAPVVGVAGEFDDMNRYKMDFAPEATEEQVAAAHTLLREWPMRREQLRLARYNYEQVENWFKEQLAAGFTASRGFRLGLSTEDVALLTGNFVLAKSGAELGLPLPPVIDMDGISHTFASIEELTFLMLEYGQYRANLSAVYASRKETVRNELKRFNIDVAV